MTLRSSREARLKWPLVFDHLMTSCAGLKENTRKTVVFSAQDTAINVISHELIGDEYNSIMYASNLQEQVRGVGCGPGASRIPVTCGAFSVSPLGLLAWL